MSSFTKTFKKVKKSVKKTTKQATDAVSKGAKEAADAAAHAATRAAGQVVGFTEDTAAAIGKTAKDTYEVALDAGVAAYNEVQDQIETWIDDALLELLMKLASAAYEKHRRVVGDLSRSARALLSDPVTSSLVQSLARQAAAKKRDAKTEQEVKALAGSPGLAPASQSASKDGWGSLSIGYGGSAAYGAGGEGSYGYAYKLKGTAIGGFFSLGGIVGSVGASVDLQLGVWTPPPPGLAGAYLAIELEVELEAGGGVQVVFALPSTDAAWRDLIAGKTSTDPVGIVVNAGAGGEVTAALGGGYTWIF